MTPIGQNPKMHVARRSAALLVVAVLAVAGAGCGSDEAEVPAAQQWAGDLCTAVNTWRDAISTAVASITSNPSQEGLEEAVDEATSATETLVDDVRDLGRPDTDAGDEASATVDELADEAESSLATINEAVDDASGGSGLLDAVSTISSTISAFSETLSESLDELRGLEDVDDELRSGFEDAEACDGLAEDAS